MKDVYLSLGSNEGKRKENLQKAIDQLSTEKFLLSKKSSLYRTSGWGDSSLKEFLNQVACFKTKLKPMEILAHCQRVEMNLGRQRKELKKGQRIYQDRMIDIDIILIDEERIETKELMVPHPHWKERKFVLVPLMEIAPSIKDPVHGLEIGEMLEGLEDQGEIIKV